MCLHQICKCILNFVFQSVSFHAFFVLRVDGLIPSNNTTKFNKSFSYLLITSKHSSKFDGYSSFNHIINKIDAQVYYISFILRPFYHSAYKKKLQLIKLG